MTIPPRQMIAECLRNGRRWAKSFHLFASTLDRMVEAGEVHRVATSGGRARNMVELTGRGWAIYFGENLVVSRLDQFAELLSQGFSPTEAGRGLGLTRGQIAVSMRDIKKHLGVQAV